MTESIPGLVQAFMIALVTVLAGFAIARELLALSNETLRQAGESRQTLDDLVARWKRLRAPRSDPPDQDGGAPPRSRPGARTPPTKQRPQGAPSRPWPPDPNR